LGEGLKRERRYNVSVSSRRCAVFSEVLAMYEFAERCTEMENLCSKLLFLKRRA